MSKTKIFLAWFLVLCLIEIALTQITGIDHSASSRSVIKNFEKQAPKTGAKLPELKIFDENGEDGEYRQRRSQHHRPRGGGPREDGATWMLVRTDERGGSRRQPRNNRRHRESRD